MSVRKRTGDIPVPLFDVRRIDFAIQWSALLHGRIVGRMLLDQPELNFVDAPGENEGQTGTGGPWLGIIQDLFPFKINRAVVHNGSIHFRVFHTKNPVDVHLSEIQASIDNLGNIRNETTPLISTVQAKGLVMNQANFDFKMTLDPFSYRPTFNLAARILGLDVTRLNELARTYGKVDFKHGWFDFVLEAEAKEGRLQGYAKPLFRNLQVFRFNQDFPEANPLQVFWEVLLEATTSVFKNQRRDQFGTLIPFSGDLSGATTADILATVANVLYNAFIRAYLPRLENSVEDPGFLQFEPPEFAERLTIGDSY
jgi:hypothetical protein